MNQPPGEELLRQANSLAQKLQMPYLSLLIQEETERLQRPETRVLFLGPTSSGKTTTINALLGSVIWDETGTPIPPVGVRPTTAQLVEFFHGMQEVRAEALSRNGSVMETADSSKIRKWMLQQDTEIRRIRIETLPVEQIPLGVVLIDSPGVGADEGEYANDLVEEALATSQLFLFHIRTMRGIGLAEDLLKRIQRLYPYKDGLDERFILVLTDTLRGAGRIDEILKQVSKILGMKAITKVIEVPSPGDVHRVAEIISAEHEHQSTPVKSFQQSVVLLSNIIIPEIKAKANMKYAMLVDWRKGSEHIQEWIRRGDSIKKQIHFEVVEAEKSIRKESLDKLDAASINIKDDLLNFVENMEQTIWESYAEQIMRIAENQTKTFQHELKEYLTEKMDELEERCNELLHSFEQELAEPYIQPEFDEFANVKQTARRAIHGVIYRRFLDNISRMGGRGGVRLGTINFARKLTSKTYKAIGKKASAQTIRRTVPRYTSGIGKALKFLEKRVWLVAAIVEVLSLGLELWRSKKRMQKMISEIMHTWVEGPKQGLWQKYVKKAKPEKGYREQILNAIDDIFHGKDGFNEQIEVACKELDNYIHNNLRKDLEENEEAILELEKLQIDLDEFYKRVQLFEGEIYEQAKK